jgi:hypothetical protein
MAFASLGVGWAADAALRNDGYRVGRPRPDQAEEYGDGL